MIIGSAIAVGLGRYSRWYILILSRGVEEGEVVYKLVAQRDDGHMYMTIRNKKKLEVDDVVEMVDSLVGLIMKNDRVKVFEILQGSGALNLVYWKKKAVWV